ncbi:MAG: selenide, water dikinase SelD [Bacteroidetes bacterium]|nr:selenide, water dikinase SelD [Bacteroidota bacterium]
MPETNLENKIALTQFSHGGGCGCKIAPAVLQQILATKSPLPTFDKLLVGNASNDDAAVFDIDGEQYLISTADFFTAIVDDPFLFGKIAAANAISDVYAMGGTPNLAIAILGFPVEQLPVEIAKQIVEGARETCLAAQIPLAGGHSIDNKEPIFGLSVNGIVKKEYLKRNNTAQAGDFLFLTKPIGVGILSSAQKQKKLRDEDYEPWVAQLTTLNTIGSELGKISGVSAMTDVTGFGLLGHLHEMSIGSHLSATLFYNRIPIIEAAKKYAAEKVIPNATYRNWNAYNASVSFEPGVNVMEAFNLLPDPQTNGGLLFAVQPNHVSSVQKILTENGYEKFTSPIGKMIPQSEKAIFVSQNEQ